MISNRELKDEIEQLTVQNQTLSDELKQLREMLKKQHDQQNQQSNENKQNQDRNQAQANGQQSIQMQNSEQNSIPIANIATEFLQLKAMTSALELKMNQFINNQTNGGQLKTEDVAYLLLNMMNGMIDWTIEYVARSQQKQSNQGNQGGQGDQESQSDQKKQK